MRPNKELGRRGLEYQRIELKSRPVERHCIREWILER